MPRVKKEENVKAGSLSQAIQAIKLHPVMTERDEQEEEIVDIIKFCEDPRFLDLRKDSDNGMELFLAQRIILKCYYIGTVGNEKLQLTQEEWEWLYALVPDENRDNECYKKNIQDVIRKMLRRQNDKDMSYFSDLHLVLGRRGTKCRWEGDRISTTEGSLTFRELCDRNRNGEKIGICTYDPKTLKRSTTYGIKLEDNAMVDCYTVETKRGIRETSSWNHPYLVWRDGWEEPKFVDMKDLANGDRIAVADKTELFGKGSIGVNRAALLGHLQGDGGTTNYVGYSTACPVMLNDFKEIIDKEFMGYEVKYKSKYDYTVQKVSGRFSQNGRQNNEVKDWLMKQDCFGKKSIEKDVPECIYKGSKEEVSAFLSRLFGCDGYAHTSSSVIKSHKTPKSQIGYCSSSEKLAYGVRHLLQKYGIHGVIKKEIARCNGKEFDTWKLIIVRKDSLIKFENEINIFSKEKRVREAVEMANNREETKSEFDSLPKGIWSYIKESMSKNRLFGSDVVGEHWAGHNDRLRMQYSPNRRKILQYGNSINDKFLKDMGTSDVKWDEVSSIAPSGKRQTVHMEVEGTHIIGGDIVSHNTLMASIITSYEAYKLLVINGGNPHKYLNLPADDEIAIINVALSEKQAGRLFGQIQSRIRNSPFFKGRIAKETTSEIRLYTNMDLKKKSNSDTNLSINGSVILLCGHSNPDSLAGYSAVLILFDEIAFFDENGKVTGTQFVGRLKPSLAKFYKYNNARMVFISSPNGRVGVFYDRWKDSETDDKILSFQLPTWDVNPDVPYEHDELERDRKSNIDLFKMEYGAQWGESNSYHPFFDPLQIERCVRGDIGPHKRPLPGLNYYMHIDPARKSHNYVAVLVAKERYLAPNGKRRNRCYLAGVWIWKPQIGEGIQFNKIDLEVLQICRLFHPVSVGYDDYNSGQSAQLLRSHGIHTIVSQFNRSMKWKIYQNVRDMMCYQPTPEIFLYNSDPNSALLIGELNGIRTKQTQRGQTICPDKSGDVKSDDCSDCLCAACSVANEGLRAGLPEPVTVQMRW